MLSRSQSPRGFSLSNPRISCWSFALHRTPCLPLSFLEEFSFSSFASVRVVVPIPPPKLLCFSFCVPPLRTAKPPVWELQPLPGYRVARVICSLPTPFIFWSFQPPSFRCLPTCHAMYVDATLNTSVIASYASFSA